MAKGNVVAGAAIGAVIGFVSGILLAPKSGKETREDIKNTALSTKDAVVENANKAKEATVQKANDLKSKAEDVAGDVSDKAVEFRSRTEQAVEGAKKGFNKKPSKKK